MFAWSCNIGLCMRHCCASTFPVRLSREFSCLKMGSCGAPASKRSFGVAEDRLLKRRFLQQSTSPSACTTGASPPKTPTADGQLNAIDRLANSFGKNYGFNRLMYNDDNVLNTLATKLSQSNMQVDWDIRMNGTIAECSFVMKFPNGQTLNGKETNSSKRGAKKDAARTLLTRLEPPTIQELDQITRWMVASHKSNIRAKEEVLDKSFGAEGHVCKLKWDIKGLDYVAQGTGKTPKEAEMYALQSLYCQTKGASSAAASKTKCNGNALEISASGGHYEELSKEDASQMNTIRAQLCNKMRVMQKEDISACSKGFVCTLSWSWTSDDGTRHEKVVVKQAASKQMAKALASKAMLIEVGAIDDVSPDESQMAKQVRDSINQNLSEAVASACQLLTRSNCSVWRMFLLQVWMAVVHRREQSLVDALVKSMTMPVQRANFAKVTSDASGQEPAEVPLVPPAIPTDIWEQLLSTASQITDPTFGPRVIKQLDLLKLNPRYFHCPESMAYYKLHSWLLALECQAGITQTLQALQTNNALNNDRMLAVKLSRAQLPLLFFEVENMEQSKNAIRRDEGLVLLLPLSHGEIRADSWSVGVIGHVTKCKTEGIVTSICVRFVSKLENNESDECFGFSEYGLISLQPMITFTRMMEALERLTHAVFPIHTSAYRYIFTPEIRDLILGTASIKPNDKNHVQLPTQMPLTPAQQLACQSAITMPLTLIQGPPGTGKTHVACAIIDCWHKMSPQHRILAVADSNVAADNLIEGLSSRGIAALRFGTGSESQVQEEAIKGLYRYNNYKQLKSSGMYREAASLRACLFAEAMKRHGIIIATCLGSGNDMLMAETFPYVIIDECAQSIEATNLVPIGRGCKSLVLIGDHKQLRPTIFSTDAAKHGLGISMLERLATNQIAPIHLLNVQRRMHPSIAEFSNAQFYNGEIGNQDVDDVTRPQVAGFKWPCKGYNVAFVDASNGTPDNEHESSYGTSRCNKLEVQVVVVVLKSFLAAKDVGPSGIGILTPYDSQKALLRCEVDKLGHMAHGIEIDSVDGFQGKEKDLIIFSAVRSNYNKQLGFLTDPRRMNVMLTRARRGLCVIGDQYTLMGDAANWGPFIAWAHTRQVYIHLAHLWDHLDTFDPEDRHRIQTLARQWHAPRCH